jgi:hypothetical protein
MAGNVSNHGHADLVGRQELAAAVDAKLNDQGGPARRELTKGRLGRGGVNLHGLPSPSLNVGEGMVQLAAGPRLGTARIRCAAATPVHRGPVPVGSLC